MTKGIIYIVLLASMVSACSDNSSDVQSAEIKRLTAQIDHLNTQMSELIKELSLPGEEKKNLYIQKNCDSQLADSFGSISALKQASVIRLMPSAEKMFSAGVDIEIVKSDNPSEVETIVDPKLREYVDANEGFISISINDLKGSNCSDQAFEAFKKVVLNSFKEWEQDKLNVKAQVDMLFSKEEFKKEKQEIKAHLVELENQKKRLGELDLP